MIAETKLSSNAQITSTFNQSQLWLKGLLINIEPLWGKSMENKDWFNVVHSSVFVSMCVCVCMQACMCQKVHAQEWSCKLWAIPKTQAFCLSVNRHTIKI